MLVAESVRGLLLAAGADSGGDYWCPACHGPVQLRRGKHKIAHFAHLPGANCCVSEGETREHLTGKRQLWTWLRAAGYQPQLEAYLPAINQRPDLLFRDGHGQLTAVEFQCSPLTVTRLRERNTGYQRLGIVPYWLLGQPYRHRLSREKQAQFTQYVAGRLTLLYWNTDSAQVETQSNLCRCSFARKSGESKAVIRRQVNQLLYRRVPTPVYTHLLQFVASQLGPQPLAYCPLVCHDTMPSWPLFMDELIYWRIKVVTMLATFPLFVAWSIDGWYQWLVRVGNPSWLAFPCLPRPPWEPIIAKYSQELQAAGIIKVINGQVILFKHPHWYKSLPEKLAAL